ncbi:MAG: NgoPII family restriction endonuclease [Gallionella sp.]|nr:NgoPII family restriction endonuclease [Gallionella sp.]MDD4959908.1 NgoPII family restriction endonuclease [Gallionella sp.]
MRVTNLLIALKNIVEHPVKDLAQHYNRSRNRANSAGEALENYIKDVFCGTLDTVDEGSRNQFFSLHFSYLGNQNNPPDMMIRGGDAIEVKKMEGNGSGIALNSSYPKDKLYADSPMLTEACKSAETWTEKDLLYVVGVAPQGVLQSLWFVYGDCYFASKDFYLKLLNFTDPLEVTTFNLLRERLLYVISPEKLIEKSVALDTSSQFLNVLMLKQKYESFPLADRQALENLAESGLSICDCQIHSPNEPSMMMSAKFISYPYPK